MRVLGPGCFLLGGILVCWSYGEWPPPIARFVSTDGYLLMAAGALLILLDHILPEDQLSSMVQPEGPHEESAPIAKR